MKKLAFYGMGAMGKTIISYIIESGKDSKIKEEYLLIDDVIEDEEYLGFPIYTFENIKKKFSPLNIEIVITNGDPEARKIMFDKVIDGGYELGNYIDPRTFVDGSVKIGKGTIVIGKGNDILFDAEIGMNNLIHNCHIAHHAKIGNHCYLSNGCSITGYCEIEDQVFMGAGVLMVDGKKIGKESVIAIGATIFKDVPANKLAIGNPAKIMKRSDNSKLFTH